MWDWRCRERQQTAVIKKVTAIPGDWILDQVPLLGSQQYSSTNCCSQRRFPQLLFTTALRQEKQTRTDEDALGQSDDALATQQ